MVVLSSSLSEAILEAIYLSLKHYRKGDFYKAEENLFGGEFKVETDSVLAEAVNIATSSSKGCGHRAATSTPAETIKEEENKLQASPIVYV